MKSSLFCPGTHLVCFVLTSIYESSFILFCFLSLDVSIGVRLPCPWSKPISHSLDVYQCLITEPLTMFVYCITTFVCCVLGLRCLFYTYSGSISFRLLSTRGLRPASALRNMHSQHFAMGRVLPRYPCIKSIFFALALVSRKF